MDSFYIQNPLGSESPGRVKSIKSFGPEGSQKELRLHQQRVVHAQCTNIQVNPTKPLMRSRGFLLYHSLGSGKTLTSIATAANLLNVREIGGTIIVVKLKTLIQWQTALKTLWPKVSSDFPQPLENQVLLTTYEQLLKAVSIGTLAGGESSAIEGGALEGGEDEDVFEPPNENEVTAAEIEIANQTQAAQEAQNAIILADVLRGSGKYKDRLKISSSLVIYDEAQRLSNLTNDTFVAKKVAEKCKKIMLMTATPYRNHPKDASVAFSLITNEWPSVVDGSKYSYGWLPVDPKAFDALFVLSSRLTPQKFVNVQTKELQQKRVANFVSYYNVRDDPAEQSHQPTRIDIDQAVTTLPMSDTQHEIYFQIQKEAVVKDATGQTKFKNAFLNRTRQACNTVQDAPGMRERPASITEPKVQAIVNEIEKQIQERVVFDRPAELPIMVYSEFIGKGIDRVDSRLREMYATKSQDSARILKITGKTSAKELLAIQQRVLVPTSQDVLLISGAGSEGLDTRGIRQVHVLESPWTQSDLDQALGRAIRQDSHKNLPASQRNVKIFKWTVAKTPAQKEREGPDVVDLTADKYVYRTVQIKDNINQQFASFLQCNSIERNVQRSTMTCTNENSLLSNPSVPSADAEALRIFRYQIRLPNFASINQERLQAIMIIAPLSEDAKHKAIIQKFTQRLLPKWSAVPVPMPAPPVQAPVPVQAPANVPKRQRENTIPVRRSQFGASFPTPTFTVVNGLVVTNNNDPDTDPRSAQNAFKTVFATIPLEKWRKAYLAQSLDYHDDKVLDEERANAKIIFEALQKFKDSQEKLGIKF